MKTKTQNSKATTDSWKIMAVTLCAALAVTLIPDLSYADDEPFRDTLCRIAKWFSGGTGKAVATIAVIFLGIAAFFGKVTWGLALMFAVGIFAIFGASTIVNTIAKGQTGANESC